MNLDAEIWDLYWHSRHAFHAGDIRAATAIYRRLRARHCVELYYEVDLRMPTRFVHPLGTVLGRATYAPHLVVYQNVGVGSDLDGNKPEFTGPCVLFPGGKVLGKVRVGSNVFVTANTVISGTEKRPAVLPDNSIVFQAPHVESEDYHDVYDYGRMDIGCRKTTRSVVERFF